MSIDIRQFRISPIEEIIGTVVDSNHDFFVMKNVLTIRTVPVNNDEYGIDLVPYSFTNPDGRVQFYKRNISSEMLDIPGGLITVYLERTSGIKIALTLDEIERVK